MPPGSALHSYDVIDPNNVVHGTLALCGWTPPTGVLTHVPKVATLVALGEVPRADLDRLAVELFRLDPTRHARAAARQAPGAPLVDTMLAHAIMYFCALAGGLWRQELHCHAHLHHLCAPAASHP
jgi:hypothetical protein